MANGKEPSVDARLISEPKAWRPVKNPIPRFLAKVQFLDNGCWEWTPPTYRSGYGVLEVSPGLSRYAHHEQGGDVSGGHQVQVLRVRMKRAQVTVPQGLASTIYSQTVPDLEVTPQTRIIAQYAADTPDRLFG